MIYGEKFTEIEPKTAVSQLLSRLKKLKIYDDDIQEFIKDKALLEEQEANLLAKMHKKYSERSKGRDITGSFEKAWNQMMQNVIETAHSKALLKEKYLKELSISFKEKEQLDSEWATLRSSESSLNKLLREHSDKASKLSKLEKQYKPGDEKNAKLAEQKEKKLNDTREQLELFMSSWKSDNVGVFNKFESIDRSQMEFLKGLYIRIIDIQLDSLKLQCMNMEQVKQTLTEIDIDKEVDYFCTNYAKDFACADDAASTGGVNSISKELKGSAKSLPGTSGPKLSVSSPPSSSSNTGPAGVSAKNEVEVDAEGFRIPQMDVNKWKNEIPGVAFDEEDGEGGQMQQSQKIRFSISEKAIEAKKEDLEAAAMQLKGALGSLNSSSATMGRRRGNRTASPSMNNRPVSMIYDYSTPNLSTTGTAKLNEVSNVSESKISPKPIAQSKTEKSPLDASSPNLTSSTKSLAAQSTTSPSPLRNTVTSESSAQEKASLSGSAKILGSIEEIDGKSSPLFQWMADSKFSIQTQEICQLTYDAQGVSSSTMISGQIVAIIKQSIPCPLTSFKIGLSPGKDKVEFKGLDDSIIALNSSGIAEFTINAASLHEGEFTTIAKYKMTSEKPKQAPLKIQAKLRVLSSQTQMVLAIERSSSSDTQIPNTSIGEMQVLATADQDATNVVCKPSAAWNPDKKKILWKVAALEKNEDETRRLLAQWDRSSSGGEVPPILCKFTCPNDCFTSFKIFSVDDAGAKAKIPTSNKSSTMAVSAIVPAAILH